MLQKFSKDEPTMASCPFPLFTASVLPIHLPKPTFSADNQHSLSVVPYPSFLTPQLPAIWLLPPNSLKLLCHDFLPNCRNQWTFSFLPLLREFSIAFLCYRPWLLPWNSCFGFQNASIFGSLLTSPISFSSPPLLASFPFKSQYSSDRIPTSVPLLLLLFP